MKKDVIQEKINKKKQEIEVLEKELKKEESKELSKNTEWIFIPELNIEVELNVHDKNKSWDELGLKDREDELLTAEQCIFLANSKYAQALKMDGSSTKDDFFIKQPFNTNRAKGYVAGFYSDRYCSIFLSNGDSRVSNDYRGVRFCRKKISRGKK